MAEEGLLMRYRRLERMEPNRITWRVYKSRVEGRWGRAHSRKGRREELKYPVIMCECVR